jgi:diaminohydroxyphosphoribosylaminopyrimidine deaminase/5-amino-6-(5-phosphoribosylamino)uracil reductase
VAKRPSHAQWLRLAVELARHCPPSPTAFSVGAVVVDADGEVLARGWSRETGPTMHAEQVALGQLAGEDPARLRAATLYSSLEPCSTRSSFPSSCTELILAAGIGRVVLALREPTVFVDCVGAERLAAAGVQVLELPELAGGVREVNAHLLR